MNSMKENLRILTYEIPESFRGQTVEAFLRSKGYSHHVIYHLRSTDTLELQGMLLNGEKTYTRKILERGDVLRINLLETEDSANVIETDLPLDIVYEDEDLMVINKPAGLPIHPSMGHYETTLGNAICYYTHHVLGYPHYVNRIINRLDRDTSGLLIAAKNMLSAAVLGDMVKRREIHREYRAIVEGDFRKICADRPGLYQSRDRRFLTVNVPIGRKDASVVERCVRYDSGEYAVTHAEFLQYDAEKNLSLLRLRLETGRTHQIRVHMQYAGCPLIGDFLYHPEYRYMQRQALHSAELSFLHPITGQKLIVNTGLPDDMAKTISDNIVKNVEELNV